MTEDYGFAEIDESRQLLGLSDFASLDEIKAAYKEAANQFHPDRNVDGRGDEEKFKRITNAYNVLTEYCGKYRYSFRRDAVKRVNMDPRIQEHLKRYYDGMWGSSADL